MIIFIKVIGEVTFAFPNVGNSSSDGYIIAKMEVRTMVRAVQHSAASRLTSLVVLTILL